MITFNLRIFNNSTGGFGGTVTVGPLSVGYYRNRRDGLYYVNLPYASYTQPGESVKVSADKLAEILGNRPGIAGAAVIEQDKLAAIGFTLKGRRYV
ncbi:hypothetical protein M6D81_13935 [Paenibacillus sp. J5C_2022]|uniref:hypothetical protein n=1 Tax=Paenibacillus sp. J5C2022 TaxID=2977129 RepID=UPI0021D2E81F|nr:hypothetical protein [Paenibacillus sp. J5C2022]MCU6709793.1 hypothetical protein [Paenibacillus sp. J5C2022]